MKLRSNKINKSQQKSGKDIKVSTVITRILIVLLTVIVLLSGFLYSLMWILVNGPSVTAREDFVMSVKETSAAGFLARIYLSKAEIAEIEAKKATKDSGETTDPGMIKLPQNNLGNGNVNHGGVIQTPDNSGEETPAPVTDPHEGIEVIDIVGSTYNGKLLIVDDPTRVFVGIPGEFGEGKHGMTVAAMADKYGAIAGTNAGGFDDPNGTGTGGIPDGIVIYEGELKWGSLGSSYSLAGIDGNGILHVGSMTGQHALDIGIQYAASYGPALVVNGKAASNSLGGGLNPRTAIGQRADGAMLLLVINGRSIDSLGASYDDLAKIMLSYGAVNASNLDGGSSSIMVMDGEFLTSSAYVFGERVVATAILVK